MCATAIPSLPRASIPFSGHSQVDLSLKEFKTLSRRYAAVVLPYSQELRILERIYYKGKNQHRSSLFWKKVSEVRRLAARIAELDLHGMFEGFRASFHASEGHNNSKSRKSAWTHVPGIDACNATLNSLRSACSLIDKGRVRLRVAFQSFKIQLTMATFIPLIVSLIAIASRLDFLMAEVRDIIPLQWEAIIRVMKVIDFRSTLHSGRSKRLPSLPVDLRPVEEVFSTRPVKKAKLTDTDLEDLGSRMERYQDIPATKGRCMDVLNSQSKGPTPDHDPLAALPTERSINVTHVDPPQPDITPNPPAVFHRTDTIASSEPTASPLLSFPPHTPISSNKTQVPSKSKSIVEVRKRNTEKVKRKRDEIDDIFGF